MGSRAKSSGLFNASDVARFCQVDLKTIHNWAERGEIEHFRTPGRHLRFRALDVLDFLRRYGYPIPEALHAGKPRVHLVEPADSVSSRMTRTLSRSFDVTTHEDTVDALLAIGANAPDAIVLDMDSQPDTAMHCLNRLGRNPSTRHVRVVVTASDPEQKPQALEQGASAFVSKSELAGLGGVLESLMGVKDPGARPGRVGV